MNKTNTELIITKLFLRYKCAVGTVTCSTHYTNLCNEIRKYIYFYPRSVKKIYSYEVCSEFLLFMDSKIEKYIARFEYDNTPFEFYLNVLLKFQFYTFLKKQNQTMKDYKFFQNTTIYHSLGLPSYTNESKIIYEKINDTTTATITTLIKILRMGVSSQSFKKRLLWFILKHFHLLQYENISILLEFCNISKETFINIKTKLQKHIQTYYEKISLLEAKKNYYFSKCRKLELYLQQNDSSIFDYKKFYQKLQRCSDKYHVFFKKYERQSANPAISNEELSHLLHVPKGTIDSGLSLFRKQCIKYYNQFFNINNSQKKT